MLYFWLICTSINLFVSKNQSEVETTREGLCNYCIIISNPCSYTINILSINGNIVCTQTLNTIKTLSDDRCKILIFFRISEDKDREIQ